MKKNQLNKVSWAELAELAQLSSAQENFDPVQLSSAQLSKIFSRLSSAQLSSENFLQIYNSGSPSGGKNLADEMSDSKSRQDAAIRKSSIIFKIYFYFSATWPENKSAE